tara:strand:- start:446 stop:1315 length:870 start_codon:yes stop_codon:yes gene_type:complete
MNIKLDLRRLSKKPIYLGKVREIYKFGDDYLILKATDRVSSFDKHIGIIEGKGILLNKMSEYWFKKTKHIIKNHYISSLDDIMLVYNCKPIKLEIIVRAYITGSTETSLWRHYNNGERIYCGIEFPDGLKKNQKLENIVVTPTTKGDIDEPISKEDIISKNILTKEECNFIYEKAKELFTFGQTIADNSGFILVDTKYEFGRNKDGEIILIDEIHTCDSSRYWIKDTYEEKIKNNQEPDKLDKDCIRDWVNKVCNPYEDDIPKIPDSIIKKAYDSYSYFYNKLIMKKSL